jgi:hypothetical protein
MYLLKLCIYLNYVFNLSKYLYFFSNVWCHCNTNPYNKGGCHRTPYKNIVICNRNLYVIYQDTRGRTHIQHVNKWSMPFPGGTMGSDKIYTHPIYGR